MGDSPIKLRCESCSTVLAFSRYDRVRPARGVALGKMANGKIRLVCPDCGSYRDLDDLTIVLLRLAPKPASIEPN